jgi:taurine--2-oxoglutarate transaminase
LTYSGHPLACAAAVASIETFDHEKLLERSRHLGEDVLGPGLRALAERHPSVGEVRGLGCFWALELVRSRDTHEPLVPFNAAGPDNAPMAEVIAACHDAGVWPVTHYNRLHVTPPLVISDDDARLGIDRLDAALTVADSYYDE